jgi:Flp pilus assembly protein TadB
LLNSVLPVLLFVSLLALFLLLFVPDRECAVSPASITIDHARRSFESRFAGDRDKEAKLKILGKTVGDVIRSSLFISTGIGLLGFLLAFFRFHWLALIVGIACFAIGFMLSQAGVDNEFKRWQARVFEEVPTIISFAPSFLKVGGITLRDAISMTVPFLSGPLRDEVWTALDKIQRTGNTRDAFNELADRIDHPVMDSICIRLSTAWDASPSPELFDDLSDQVQDVEEIAAAGATAGKAGLLALICVLGLLGALLVFAYPAWLYMASQFTMGFGA